MFYGYVASLPFEIPQRSIPVEVHTVTGAILLTACLFDARACFRRPPAAFWAFALYFYVYVCFGVFTEHTGQWMKDSLTLLQVTLLFWVTSSLMRSISVARIALVTLIGSCCVLALLQRFGITAGVAETGAIAERVTALGQNPNTFANNLALALIALVGLTYASRTPIVSFRPLICGPAALLALAIMPTASRGGVLALVAGLPLVLLRAPTVAGHVRNVGMMVILLAGIMLAAYRADGMRNRFLAAEGGDLAQRENLYPAAWDMFVERPIIGWGPVNNRYELEHRVPRVELPFRETHNLFLELLTETGLVGAAPFLAGIALCLVAAWRSRHGPHGIMPFAMTVSVVVSKMGSAWIGSKMHWLVLAFAVASAISARADGRLRSERWRVGRAVAGADGRRFRPDRQLPSCAG